MAYYHRFEFHFMNKRLTLSSKERVTIIVSRTHVKRPKKTPDCPCQPLCTAAECFFASKIRHTVHTDQGDHRTTRCKSSGESVSFCHSVAAPLPLYPSPIQRHRCCLSLQFSALRSNFHFAGGSTSQVEAQVETQVEA